MLTRTFSLAAFLLGLLALAGCSSAMKLEKIGVRIQEVAAAPAGVTLTLRFINPNNVPLVVAGGKHVLYLDGEFIGVVESRKPLGVPPLGSVETPVALSPQVAKTVGVFAADHPGPTAYALESTLHLDWNGDLVDYKTRDEGRVTLPPSVRPEVRAGAGAR